jgi:hypothetical protein
MTDERCKACLLILYSDSTTNPYHYYIVTLVNKAKLETPEATFEYIEAHGLNIVSCSVNIAGYDDAKRQQSLEAMGVLQKIAAELENLRFVSDTCGDVQYEVWGELQSIQFPSMKKACLNLMMNERGYETFTMTDGMFPVTARIDILINAYYECHLHVMNDAAICNVTISTDHWVETLNPKPSTSLGFRV